MFQRHYGLEFLCQAPPPPTPGSQNSFGEQHAVPIMDSLSAACLWYASPSPLVPAIRFRGHTTQNLRGLSPKRDCNPKTSTQVALLLTPPLPSAARVSSCVAGEAMVNPFLGPFLPLRSQQGLLV